MRRGNERTPFGEMGGIFSKGDKDAMPPPTSTARIVGELGRSLWDRNMIRLIFDFVPGLFELHDIFTTTPKSFGFTRLITTPNKAVLVSPRRTAIVLPHRLEVKKSEHSEARTIVWIENKPFLTEETDQRSISPDGKYLASIRKKDICISRISEGRKKHIMVRCIPKRCEKILYSKKWLYFRRKLDWFACPHIGGPEKKVPFPPSAYNVVTSDHFVASAGKHDVIVLRKADHKRVATFRDYPETDSVFHWMGFSPNQKYFAVAQSRDMEDDFQWSIVVVNIVLYSTKTWKKIKSYALLPLTEHLGFVNDETILGWDNWNMYFLYLWHFF